MNIKKNIFSLFGLTFLLSHVLQALENTRWDQEIKRNETLCYTMDLLPTGNTTDRQSTAGLTDASEKQKENRENSLINIFSRSKKADFLIEVTNNVFKITRKKFTLEKMGIPTGGVYEIEEEQVFRKKYSGNINSIKLSPKGDCVVWECIDEGPHNQSRRVNITNLLSERMAETVSSVITQRNECPYTFSQEGEFLVVPANNAIFCYKREAEGYSLLRWLPMPNNSKILSASFRQANILCLQHGSSSDSYVELNEKGLFEWRASEISHKKE